MSDAVHIANEAAQVANAIPVKTVGTTMWGVAATKLTAIGVWTGVISGIFGLIALFVKARVPMRKMKIEAEEKLRVDMMSQMAAERLERHTEKTDLINRMGMIEQKLETMRAQYEAKIEKQRSESTSEISFLRHKMNNLDSCFNSFLMLVEANPDDPEKIREAVRMAREMRSKQEQEEKSEKAQYAGARAATADFMSSKLGDPEDEDL